MTQDRIQSLKYNYGEGILEGLTELSSLNSFEGKVYEKIAFYVEALYFCDVRSS